MKPAKLLGLGVLIALAGLAVGRQTGGGNGSAPSHPPRLTNICLISADVKKLATFYEPILGFKPVWSGEDYVEFRTGTGVLAIFSSAAQEKYIPDATEPGQNKSAILEFSVVNVDQEYARLQSLVKTWVKPPTTQPWGTRSIYFRDPDGNLVDFCTPREGQ